MSGDELTDRMLGRATLARQLLLKRSSMPIVDAVEHLVGLQAQNPLDPYLSLWSRLDGFDRDELGRLLTDRVLVRMVVMRATIHLLTADDGLGLRPLMQPVLDAEIKRHRDFAPLLADVDPVPVMEVVRPLLAEQPMSGRRLAAAIEERFEGLPGPALAYASRCLLPLVQVPPRGVWGRTKEVTLAPLDEWIGRSLPAPVAIDDVVLRYLAAFGPATVADVSAWSRLTGMREVLERLRQRLRVFHGERRQELFDLPDAPRPDPELPAPVRFFPEYDNVFLSHADRTRFGGGDPLRFAGVRGPIKGTVTVDGLVEAVWHSTVDRASGRATLVVEHRKVPRAALRALEVEAQLAATVWHPDAAEREVELRPIRLDE